MNNETRPKAQMPHGKADNDPNTPKEDGLLFEGGISMGETSPAGLIAATPLAVNTPVYSSGFRG